MTDSALLPATRVGAGPPMLLLHGLGSSRRDWATLQPRLATFLDVLAVDLPGQGEARPLPDRPTVKRLTNAVERDLDARGLDRVHVLGNSLGGRLALELARRGRAHSVLAVSPSGSNLPPERVVQATGYGTAALLVRLLRPAVEPLSHSALARTAMLASLRLRGWQSTPEEAQALEDGFGSPDFWRLLLWSTLLDVPGPMRGIDVPVTLAQGTHDWVAGGQTPRYLGLVPGARLSVLPFAGHAPLSDVPDLIVDLVRETIARAA